MRGRLFYVGVILVALGALLALYNWFAPVSCPANGCSEYYVLWYSISLGIVLTGDALVLAQFAFGRNKARASV